MQKFYISYYLDDYFHKYSILAVNEYEAITDTMKNLKLVKDKVNNFKIERK